VNYDQLYPGRFLKAGTLEGKKATLLIAEIVHERLEGDDGEKLKAVMSFAGKDMQLVLAKTNALCLKAMFGPILANWKGKRITIAESKVESGSLKGQPCIRVWGSPDIPGDMAAIIKLPKKKAFEIMMHKTDAPKGGAAVPAVPVPPAENPADVPYPPAEESPEPPPPVDQE
jgi:hypothetical protein